MKKPVICVICGKRHSVLSTGWVILASGDEVCYGPKETCWGYLQEVERDIEDARRRTLDNVKDR